MLFTYNNLFPNKIKRLNSILKHPIPIDFCINLGYNQIKGRAYGR